jgi:hypothetical protein
LKLRHLRHGIVHDWDALEGGHDLARAAKEGLLEGGQGDSMIDGAERLGPSGRSLWDKSGGGGIGRGVKQLAEKFGRQGGHIASGNQVPVGPGVAERGENSAEGSFAGKEVGDRGITGDRRAADQHDAACGGLDGASDGGGQDAAPKRKNRFVAPHPGTAASGQHVARPTHMKMIPLEFAESGGWRGNIVMRFCFTIWIGGMVAASLLRGGDAPVPSKHITSVVRTDPRSGRLVRSVIVTSRTVAERPVAENVVAPRMVGPAAPAAAAPAPPTGIDEAVERIAAQQAVPPELLHSVIQVESNYNPYAVSPKGAQGLMQLIPATARRFGVDNVFNPVENIQGGARYLRYLLDLYHWDLPLTLAAYNAGEAAVSKYGGVPPYRETQNYLVSVKKRLDKAAGRKAQAPAAKPAAPPRDPAEPNHMQAILETDGTVRYVSR